MTLEQQLDQVMSSSGINTLQVTAQREEDGSIRFYSTVHADGFCVFSVLMNLPTVREAIESSIKALNEKRLPAPVIGDLQSMEQAA